MIFIDPFLYETTIQGSWRAITADGTHVRDMLLDNTLSSADGDAVEYTRYIPKGTYSMRLVYLTGPTCGIAKVKIDGTTVFTKDQYTAGWVKNGKSTATGIVIAVSGIKTIRFCVDGKNDSSSDYVVYAQMLGMWRTAL